MVKSKITKEKSVVDELREYNKELETHLPDLDFDFLKSGSVFKDKHEFNDDISSLVASNLIDLKTEMALVRRNLTDSIEGMVMRSLTEQQTQFSKFMDDFYKKMTLSFKQTVSNFGEGLSDEFSNMSKDIERISLSNKVLSGNLKDFGNDFVEVKSIFEEFGEFKGDIKSLLEKKFKSIDVRLSKIEEFSNTIDLNKSGIDKIKMSKTTDAVILSPEFKNTILEVPQVVSDDDFRFEPNSTVDKLIAIDSRLKKLNSLR